MSVQFKRILVALALMASPCILLGRIGFTLEGGLAVYVSVPVMIWYIVKMFRCFKLQQLSVVASFLSVCMAVSYLGAAAMVVGASVAGHYTKIEWAVPFIGFYILLLICQVKSVGFPDALQRTVWVMTVLAIIVSANIWLDVAFPEAMK